MSFLGSVVAVPFPIGFLTAAVVSLDEHCININ